jgi:drug/metabolite transporter (DMT)-like permease
MLGVAAVYAATLVLFVQATKETTSANAIFLQSTAPIYVLLASPFLLHEPIRRADVLFLLALALGLASVVSGHQTPQTTAPHPLAGNLAAAASGMTWAATVIGLRWLGTRGDAGGSTEPALVAGNVLAAVCTLPMALPVSGVSATNWLVILYLGVFQIGLAYVCLSKGMAGVPAVEASLLLLLEPVLNPLWSWLVHDEAPGGRALAGGAIILAATAVRTVWDIRRG